MVSRIAPNHALTLIRPPPLPSWSPSLSAGALTAGAVGGELGCDPLAAGLFATGAGAGGAVGRDTLEMLMVNYPLM